MDNLQSEICNPKSSFGLLLSDDMIFTSRITGTARGLGLTLKPARSADVLETLARQQTPSCVIVDLANPGLNVPDLLTHLGEICSPMPRVVAYGSHVDAAGLRAAQLPNAICRARSRLPLRPQPQAPLGLTARQYHAEASDGTVEPQMNDRTDADGRFTVKGVAPAPGYTVVIWFAFRELSPALLIFLEVARVPAHARLDAERVTQQRLALRVRRQRLPGAFACDFHRVGRLPRCLRRP